MCNAWQVLRCDVKVETVIKFRDVHRSILKIDEWIQEGAHWNKFELTNQWHFEITRHIAFHPTTSKTVPQTCSRLYVIIVPTNKKASAWESLEECLWPWVCDPPFSLVPLVLLPRTGNHKSELLLLSLGLGARDTTVASVLFWLHLYKLEQAEMKGKVKCSRLKPQRRFTRSDKKPTSHLSPHLPLVWSFIRKKPEFDEQRIFFKVLPCFISNEQPQD